MDCEWSFANEVWLDCGICKGKEEFFEDFYSWIDCIDFYSDFSLERRCDEDTMLSSIADD